MELQSSILRCRDLLRQQVLCRTLQRPLDCMAAGGAGRLAEPANHSAWLVCEAHALVLPSHSPARQLVQGAAAAQGEEHGSEWTQGRKRCLWTASICFQVQEMNARANTDAALAAPVLPGISRNGATAGAEPRASSRQNKCNLRGAGRAPGRVGGGWGRKRRRSGRSAGGGRRGGGGWSGGPRGAGRRRQLGGGWGRERRRRGWGSRGGRRWQGMPRGWRSVGLRRKRRQKRERRGR